jgi:hypothetical protein
MPGRHTYNQPDPIDPFNDRVRAFLTDDASTLPPEEQLTAEQIKAAGLLAIAADQQTQDRNASREFGDAFVATHAEYIDTGVIGAKNGKLMNHTLKVMFGDVAYTPDHFDAAYQSLRADGLLTLNQAEVAKQQKDAANQKAVTFKAAKSNQPTEEELYSMPMEDLRRLDAQHSQQQMRKGAEEGGW